MILQCQLSVSLLEVVRGAIRFHALKTMNEVLKKELIKQKILILTQNIVISSFFHHFAVYVVVRKVFKLSEEKKNVLATVSVVTLKDN